MKLEKKKQIVDDLQEKFARSKIVILTNFNGLDVATMSILRRQLREAKVEYRVVKNSLLARASENNTVAVDQRQIKRSQCGCV